MQEGPKGKKGTLRPYFKTSAYPILLLKKPMFHKKQERGSKEIQE